MEKELSELKTVLRSLAVSCPSQLDVRSLQRDYRNMMGAPIPIAKFGYKDILAFLKERCDDCFVFQGLSSNPVLTPIVTKNMKHIDKFVQNQKTSSHAKIKGKRRSVPESAIRAPRDTNTICQTFHRSPAPAPAAPHYNNNTPPEVKPPDITRYSINRSSNYVSTNYINNASTNIINKTSTDDINRNEDVTAAKSIVNLKPESEYVNSNSHVMKSECNGDIQNFYKKRLPAFDSTQYLNSEGCSGADKDSSKDDKDSGMQTSSSQSSTKRAQLEQLKCEIHDLIKEQEDGVWITDLMRHYRERYDREMNLTRFGHNNISSLLCTMEERVTFSSEAGGVRVRDAAPARAPATTRAPAPRPRAPPRPAPRVPDLRALPVDADDALPGIDFDPDVFPADCMQFSDSVPALALGGVAAGAMLQVLVAEVYSPSHFWLQLLGEQHHLALDDLMDEMAEYYERGEGRRRSLAAGAARPGHYCSSLYARDWHRSLVIKIVDADTVKVRHVDYGTVDTVSVWALKPLLRRWARLPAQAVRARLAGLRPGAAGRRWPHAAAAHFLGLVSDKRFVANVVAVDPEEDTIETFLIDTSGADDVCLTAEMIRAGHADPRPDSALRTSECYLYPRFTALENGDTPNFAEIHRYLADGISLEYVEAYRRHVPAALPARASPPASPPAPAPPAAAPSADPLEVVNRIPLLRVDSPPPSPPRAAPAAARAPPPLQSTPPIDRWWAAPAPWWGAQPPPPPFPCPGAGGSTGAGEVRLSAEECEIYSLLRSVDAEAAHCYLETALRRAAAPPAPPARRSAPLNPHAPVFRVAYHSPYGAMRPPPGF